MKAPSLGVCCGSTLLLLCFVYPQMGTAYPSVAEGPSQWLVDQAKAMQINDVILEELWRTRQPVVITKTDAEGQECSETYELSPDGRGISRTTRRGTLPAKLEANTGDAVKPDEQWETLPKQLPQPFIPDFGTDFRFSLRNGFSNPFDSFGGLNGFHQRSAQWPSFSLPAGVTPRTSTKTEVDDQGRTITSRTSYYNGPVEPGTNLFESQFPGAAAPSPFPGQASPPNWTAFGRPLPSLPSPRPIAPQPPLALAPSYGLDILTTTPLPSLDDFLQQQTTPRVEGNPDEGTPPPLPTRRPLANGPQEGDKSIENYLSQVNLSPSDILAQNGEVVKTIVDKDGRVLSARFVLSTVRGEEPRPQEPQPTK